MRPSILTLSLILLIAASGCESSSPAGDAGHDASRQDAGPDAAVQLCAANRDCDDGTYCNGRETCEPGSPDSSADGCRPGPPPCSAGFCDEAMNRCGCEGGGDADDDGERSIACGGNDCDDDDDTRYPGNAEVCDPDGHDEDCDPATLGGTDADSDGFVSAACCNGERCGTDCDDDDINVNPGAAESCDGIDNNCDGVPDVSPEPLCPGGTCTAGSCRLDAWVRTFGGAGHDTVDDVAIDRDGNVYVVGSMAGPADFGAGPVTALGEDPVLASYTADGALRWQRSFGYPDFDAADDVVVDERGRVFITIRWQAGDTDIDFGGGPVAAERSAGVALVALDASDGSYAWHRYLGGYSNRSVQIAGTEDGVVLAHNGPDLNIGGPAPFPLSSSLSRLASDGSWVWGRVLSETGFGSMAIDTNATSVVVVGTLSEATSIGGGILPFEEGSRLDLAFGRFSTADGSHIWSQSYPSSGFPIPFAVTQNDSGTACAGGRFSGTLTYAPGVSTHVTPDLVDGFVVCFDSTGSYAWHRTLPGEEAETVWALDTDSTGHVLVAGGFSGSINLGSGLTDTGAPNSAFVARYAPDGSHRWDRVFPANDSEASAVAVGPADSTVVVGNFWGSAELLGRARRSAGEADGFIVRLDR